MTELIDTHGGREARRPEGEESFRLFVEAVRDYAIFMLDPRGHIISWNPGAERIKGWRAEEILGQHFSIFYPEEDLRSGKPDEELRIAIATGRYQEEGWRLRKDRSRFMAEVTITAVYDHAGTLRGFGKVTRDITERKQAENEVRELAASLERRVAERTARLIELNGELDGFAYSVSHDLRAPLRAMEGYATALAEDYGDRLDGDAHGYLERIVGAARRMHGLIEDLLAYSRLSQDEVVLQPTDLARVVGRVCQEMAPELEAQKAEMRIAPPLPPVRAHAPMLRQVVSNLITNAVKFVAVGVAPRVTVRAEDNAGLVKLFVEDNGIGIAPEHRERVFRVFERLHGRETYPGSGIGLAIVRKAVERMGGAVGVDSNPETGSQFWIELPRAEGME